MLYNAGDRRSPLLPYQKTVVANLLRPLLQPCQNGSSEFIGPLYTIKANRMVYI